MKLLLKLFLLLSISPVFANNNQSLVNQNFELKTNLNNLSSITCDRAATNCVALGIIREDNHNFFRVIYTTDDGGDTWSTPVKLNFIQESLSYNDELLSGSIACDENATKCIVTHFIMHGKIINPVIHKSYDGGKTWTNPKILPIKLDKISLSLLQSETNHINATYIKISCDMSATNCVLAGSIVSTRVLVPIILSTKNSGDSWIFADRLIRPKHASPISIINGITLLDVDCDETGKICKTVGNTIARNSVMNDYYASLPVVYSSHDGGKKWGNPQIMPTKIQINKSDTLIGVSCDISGEKCTVAGITFEDDKDKNTTFIFNTKDGGKNWGKKIKLQTLDAKEYPAALVCDKYNKRCIITGYSVIRKNGLNYYQGIYYVSNSKKIWQRHTVNNNFENTSIINDIACDDHLNKCIGVGYK